MFTQEFRPQRFDQVVGQDVNIEVLKAIINKPDQAPRSIILGGEFGTGKCIPGWTRVMTKDGYFPIDTYCRSTEQGFTPNDTLSVQTRTGWRKISHTYKGKAKVTTLWLSNGYKVRGTLEHGLLSDKTGQPALLPIKDLAIGDSLLFSSQAMQGGTDIGVETAYQLGCQKGIKYDISAEIWASDVKCRQAFIEGVLLTQGSIDRAGFCYIDNLTYPYSSELQELLLTLGVVAKLSYNIDKGLAVSFSAKMMKESAGYLPSRVRELSSNPLELVYGQYYRVPISKKIESLLEHDVYDFTVPEVHEFYAQGIYNHNSTMARIFAKSLNCLDRQGSEPCGICKNCLCGIDESPFYFEYDSGVMGTVDHIRELRDTFYYRSNKYYKVINLDESHRISKAGQAALLKVVEEAPAGIFFIWSTTDVDSLLSTIRSRSLYLRFGLVAPKDVLKSLDSIISQKKLEVTSQVKELIISRSHGHMRDAHMLLDLFTLVEEDKFKQIVKTSYRSLAQYFQALKANNKEQVLAAVEELTSYPLATLKLDFEEFLFSLTKSSVNLPAMKETDFVFSLYGQDTLKLVRVCMSDWVINSFSSEVMFKAAFLALFQFLSPQSPQKAKLIENRNIKR